MKGNAATNCGLSPAASDASQRVCHQPAGASALPLLNSFHVTRTVWPGAAVAGAATSLTNKSGRAVSTVSNALPLETDPAALLMRTL